MNDQQRAQLEWLKQEHLRLQQDLKVLSRHLQAFEKDLQSTEATPAPESPASKTTIPPISLSPAPPVIQTAYSSPSPKTQESAPAMPCPPGARQSPAPVLSPGSQPETRFPAQAVNAPSPSPAQPPRSFELRLGTYWFVRLGVVMVLTAAVFFGKLAYQNLGPAGKISLLYLGSVLLLAAGAWWLRKAASESLKNYAQVLFAGGQAGVYFTTYAAHHVDELRIIPSALTDGILLLLWAGFMVWMADRKKSEVLALFAIGLAYYTSIITRVGSFTLYSNLVLAIAAVFFMVRNRWAALSFAGLAASYLAYGFWRFYNGSEWHWASPEQGLWTGAVFLFSYWAVFTAGVFLSRDPKLAGLNRAAFLTLNNGAMFTMFVLTMLQVQTGGFWKFSLSYGTVLLVLAAPAWFLFPKEPLTANGYLTQGLLLVTVGFISKFSGLQLSLILAAESVIVHLLGRQRRNAVLIVASYIVAGLATGWAIDGITPVRPAGLYLALGVGILMLANTSVAHRTTTVPGTNPLRPGATWFSILALLVFLLATWHYTTRQNFPLVLAAEALVLTGSLYLLAVPELVWLAQSYVVLAHLAWLVNASWQVLPPWWNPALLILFTVGLAHWWQRRPLLRPAFDFGILCQMLYALAVVGVLSFWFQDQLEPARWVALAALLAILLTAYAVLTRWWYLGLAAQIFVVSSGLLFTELLARQKPFWFWMLAPIVALNVLALATNWWFNQHPEKTGRTRETLSGLAIAYRWAALVMMIWFVGKYIPGRQQIWVFAAFGAAVFLWAGRAPNREALLYSASLSLTALILFWAPFNYAPRMYGPNLLAILLIAAQQQIARRFPSRYELPPPAHTAAILAAGLSLWLYISRWVLVQQSGFYLTASWSALALALFTVGIASRERIYRWLGLVILACALARVFVFDVWKLETLYRIISFLALGVVLIVLGFIYNKYQDKLRQWL